MKRKRANRRSRKKRWRRIRRKSLINHSRREDPYDHTVPNDGEQHEEDVEDAEHIVEEGVGRLEGPPVGVDVLEVVRGGVVSKHLHFVACGRHHAGLRTPKKGMGDGGWGQRRNGRWIWWWEWVWRTKNKNIKQEYLENIGLSASSTMSKEIFRRFPDFGGKWLIPWSSCRPFDIVAFVILAWVF